LEVLLADFDKERRRGGLIKFFFVSFLIFLSYDSFGMNMMRREVFLMRYFPMRPPIVSLGLLCDNRAQDMRGTNLYFRERMRTKEEDLSRIIMSLKRLVMSSILKREKLAEPGRATVSST
jgi:hypothetical protein